MFKDTQRLSEGRFDQISIFVRYKEIISREDLIKYECF